jgi:tetratricopeptide (TPR) repeat protein
MGFLCPSWSPWADETLGRAVEVFSAFGDIGGVSWSKGTEGFVRLLQGRLRAARDLAEELLPTSQESGDEWGTAACLTIHALASAELGELTVAARRAAEAEARYAAIGDSWGRTLALVARGAAARGAGQPEAAVEYLCDALVLAERARQPSTMIMALVGLGWTLHDARDVDGAEAAAYRALDLAHEIGLEPHTEVGCRVLVALAHRARGDHDRALAILSQIAASPEQPTLLFPMRQALAHYAGTLLDSGAPGPALEVAERAIATPAEDVRSRVISLRAYGAALAANGRRDEAERVLAEAVEAASATEQRLERATTERVLADVLAGRR